MPFINTRTNATITPEQEASIKAKLGDAIRCLGKSEGWLMLNFEDNCRLWFKGDNRKSIAMVEISLFGRANESAYNDMTKQVTTLLSQELSISPDSIYVKYEEVDNWGWNGNNF